MTEERLMDHARAYYKENGIEMPNIETDLGKIAYETWARWSFSNLYDKKTGKGAKDQKISKRMLDEFVDKLRG